jgi:hypothetical protein
VIQTRDLYNAEAIIKRTAEFRERRRAATPSKAEKSEFNDYFLKTGPNPQTGRKKSSNYT